MSLTQQLIGAAYARYKAMGFVTIAEVRSEMSKPISLEEKRALSMVMGEIQAVINDQILVQYLTAMGIPELEWVEYSFDGVQVIHHVEQD